MQFTFSGLTALQVLGGCEASEKTIDFNDLDALVYIHCTKKIKDIVTKCKFTEHTSFYKFVVGIVNDLIAEDDEKYDSPARFKIFMKCYFIVHAPGMKLNGENRPFLDCIVKKLFSIFERVGDVDQNILEVATESIKLINVLHQTKITPKSPSLL